MPVIPDKLPADVPALAFASTKPWPYFGVSADHARECKLAYYAAISFVDAQIGRLIDEVDKLGLAQNTVIVFWSDHGYHLGEHGLFFKQSCFEESTRVPLIICAPGVAGGKTSPRLVELVDLYPTLADLTGVTPTRGLQGTSIRPLLANPEAQWDLPAYSQVERGKKEPGLSVRTPKWRYTEWGWGKDGEELYDHDADPQEQNNLAKDPGHAQTVAEMKALLHKVHPELVEGGKAEANTKEKYVN
jgi:uncharacterized sulfatase